MRAASTQKECPLPELWMEAVNEALQNHGVECIKGRHVDNYHYDIQACYSNTGDSYALTILHDNERREFILTSMGDWVEKNEKRRQLQ